MIGGNVAGEVAAAWGACIEPALPCLHEVGNYGV